MTREEKWLLEEKYGGKETPGFAADRDRLAAGEPVAYVIGWQPFLGLKIYLDSKTLIPRSETEWWVERAAVTGGARILDLCAGSGAIGCAMLKMIPAARVSFGEIDPAHEATIRKNIRENNLDESRTSIGIGDLFAPFASEKFDLILANPPYIPEDRVLPESVAKYEPRRALFAGADGLAIIDRIASKLAEHLLPDGEAWIECDSEHAESARGRFAAAGFSTRILNDQFDAPRVIVVSFAQ